MFATFGGSAPAAPFRIQGGRKTKDLKSISKKEFAKRDIAPAKFSKNLGELVDVGGGRKRQYLPGAALQRLRGTKGYEGIKGLTIKTRTFREDSEEPLRRETKGYLEFTDQELRDWQESSGADDYASFLNERLFDDPTGRQREKITQDINVARKQLYFSQFRGAVRRTGPRLIGQGPAPARGSRVAVPAAVRRARRGGRDEDTLLSTRDKLGGI